MNIVNFQTLVATKAARICGATSGEPVVEFGLRRAQGIDGALAASRAAFSVGCAATSNVLGGRLFGIPVRGTHAQSWVMSFDDELSAFEAYAAASPNNCVFLVDTYDTLDGVRHAIQVGQRLKQAGHKAPDRRPILEINPCHPLVARLRGEDSQFADWSQLLFDQANLAEGGQLEDPAGFVRRLNGMLLSMSAQG